MTLDTPYIESAFSLIPPVIAILLAILTRKVLFSLGVGIVLGVLLLANFSLYESSTLLLDKTVSLVWVDSGWNAWNLYIIGFLVLLGMMTALMSVSGAATAFAEALHDKIKNRQQAQLLTVFLGIVVFIDDYFNSLVVGSVSQPIADRYRVSRAKLAYLLDSTAAPVCVLMPISSWGAYITALIAGMLIFDGQAVSSMSMVIELIPYNFYAIFALLLVFMVVMLKLDIGPMARFEALSLATEIERTESTPTEPGSMTVLLLPISILVVVTLFLMLLTGFYNLPNDVSPQLMLLLENLDLGFSLFYGALLSLLVTVIMVLKRGLIIESVLKSLWGGFLSMLPAILILLFAWTIASVINDLATGKYLAQIALANIAIYYLAPLLFLLTGFIAFASGTSWGTFGIMLPIAVDLAIGSDTQLLMPLMAAVLSGAVFGDHCSPISDTTILSSTGAGCPHMDHVISQLPYTLISAFISIVGFLVLGLTYSLWLSLLACTVTFVICLWLLNKWKHLKQPEVDTRG